MAVDGSVGNDYFTMNQLVPIKDAVEILVACNISTASWDTGSLKEGLGLIHNLPRGPM